MILGGSEMKICTILLIALHIKMLYVPTYSYADIAQPTDIREGQIVCIPIYLDQQDIDIIGIDITIHYSSLFLVFSKISLRGGFLEREYSLTIGNQITDEISLGIYATGGIRKGTGSIAKLYFICKGNHNDQGNISIKKFLVNDLYAKGGLVWKNFCSTQLDFAVKKCTLADVINGLQILIGFQSITNWVDMNGNEWPGIDDVLQLIIQSAITNSESLYDKQKDY